MTSQDLENNLQKLLAENSHLREEIFRLQSILKQHGIQYYFPDQENQNRIRQQNRLKLYRSYFLGRDDVYANRWYNKQLKKQYSPAEKRAFRKWNEREHRFERIDLGGQSPYEPLTDEVLFRHFRTKEENGGKAFAIGLYLIVNDDECYLSAIDFDGKTWEKDVQQAARILKELNFPYLIERSQSGVGAHIWFFFSTSIKAKKARQFCSSLITLTMEKNAFIRMETYDRIFHSQDRVTKNGLGSLIALPLEGDARKIGNSSFLDENLQVIRNPWDALKQTNKIEEATIDNFLSSLGSAFDMGEMGLKQEKSLPLVIEKSNEIPQTISLVLDTGISCCIQGLSSPLVNKLKRIASFHNQEFYKAERLRLSTWNKPRVICCANLDDAGFLVLPRGCRMQAALTFEEAGIAVQIDDRRTKGVSIQYTFLGVLKEAQKKAVQAMEGEECGILCAPPGFGKTVIASALIAKRSCSTLIIVHTKPLLMQWRERLDFFLGVEPGILGGGKQSLKGTIDVALIHSLSQDEHILRLSDYGLVIVDECHHVAAYTYEKVLKAVKAKFVYGLTATPIRNDGHHDIVFMQCGPILHYVDQALWTLQSNLSGTVISRFSPFRCDHQTLEIQQMYEKLCQDSKRNQMIVSDIQEQCMKDRSILVLSTRLEQLSLLYTLLENKNLPAIIMTGRQSAKSKRQVQAYLASIVQEHKPVLILSTGKYIGEGFDLPQLDTLVLASPIAWKGNVVQYAGRIARAYENKKEMLVLDYLDYKIPVFVRMFGKRVNAYKKIGLPVSVYGQQQREQLVYTSETYWEVLKQDLLQEKEEIIFSAPTLMYSVLQSRISFLKVLTSSNQKVSMLLRDPGNQRVLPLLQRIGIVVRQTNDELANYILVGNRIVWYGSINFFGKSYPDDTYLRLEDPTYATDFKNIGKKNDDLSLFD